MTVGILLIVGIGVLGWVVPRAIDKTDAARQSRAIQVVALLLGGSAAAAPMVLVVLEFIPRTTATELAAAAAFVVLCMRRYRLIWGERVERSRERREGASEE